MFRFSLLTLVLLSLWAGSAMLVWRLRAPWVLAGQEKHLVSAEPPAVLHEPTWAWTTAGTRRALWKGDMSVSHDGEIWFPGPSSRITIHDLGGEDLASFDADRQVRSMRFLDDETLVCENFFSEVRDELGRANYLVGKTTYRRRFPEWWWGHLCRPEVWLLLALSLALANIALRHARRQLLKITRPEPRCSKNASP